MKEYFLKERELPRANLVMMTPGQESQFNGMAADLVQHPVGAAVFREVDGILGFGLTESMCDPAGEALRDNAMAQPAIVATTIAAKEVYQAEHPDMADIIPSFYIGHSLGELTALYFAGVLSAHDVLIIARERGKLMQQVAEKTPGGMVTVITNKNRDEVKESDLLTIVDICDQTGVYLAAYNSSSQYTISGLTANIEEAIKLLRKHNGFMLFPLQNVPPSHTIYMKPAMKGLKQFIEDQGIVFRDPHSPVIMNATGKSASWGADIKSGFIGQLVQPVRFDQGIQFARSYGVFSFMEFGPKELLAKLIPQIFPKMYSKDREPYFSAVSVFNVASARSTILTIK